MLPAWRRPPSFRRLGVHSALPNLHRAFSSSMAPSLSHSLLHPLAAASDLPPPARAAAASEALLLLTHAKVGRNCRTCRIDGRENGTDAATNCPARPRPAAAAARSSVPRRLPAACLPASLPPGHPRARAHTAGAVWNRTLVLVSRASGGRSVRAQTRKRQRGGRGSLLRRPVHLPPTAGAASRHLCDASVTDQCIVPWRMGGAVGSLTQVVS